MSRDYIPSRTQRAPALPQLRSVPIRGSGGWALRCEQLDDHSERAEARWIREGMSP